MKAWAIDRYGDNSVVTMREMPTPEPRANEVLVAIRAASINPVDFKIRNGDVKLILKYDFPLVLGSDCSGVVISNGRKFKEGDEVFTRPQKDRIGTLAQFISVDEDTLALKPKNISFEEAASLPLAGLTAHQAFERVNLKAGQRIFIPAGAGGVGSLAIQLAKNRGAHVIANCSSRNVEFVQKLGADEVIDYLKEDFSRVVLPVDVVFDTMGGDTQARGFHILKEGGTLISIVGPPTAAFAREAGVNPFLQMGAGILGLPAWYRARKVRGHYQFMFMLPSGSDLKYLASLVEAGKLVPHLDSIFEFSAADKAIARVEDGHARGKVIVRVAGA